MSQSITPITVAGQPRAPARRRPHRARWLLGSLGLAVLLMAAFYAGGGWYLSGVLAESALDAAALRAASASHSYTIPVLAVETTVPGHNTITLSVPAQPAELVVEGVWGVQAADGGFGDVGRIKARGSRTISRDFWQLTGPPIHAGEKLELVNNSFPENPATGLGIPYQDVSFPGPLGSYPAWFIAGTAPDWAVLVHGKGLNRQDEMEVIGAIHSAGLPMLVITYRNDPGAPPDPSGMVRYGLTEWRDVEAAVGYALRHGAHRVLLNGRSMGGGVVVSFLEHSRLAPVVNAVILDSPMLDFSRTVDYGASQRSLPLVGLPIPGSLTAVAKWIAGWRYGVDWANLNYLTSDARLRAPVLLFQGTGDKTVPPATSNQLAKDRPDLVTYVLTPGAGHLDSWNLDPIRYERYVERFATAHAAD
jgi:alpha-beta hydrolase superfamily lysophospholipase